MNFFIETCPPKNPTFLFKWGVNVKPIYSAIILTRYDLLNQIEMSLKGSNKNDVFDIFFCPNLAITITNVGKTMFVE